MATGPTEDEISQIHQRLLALDTERKRLEARLMELEQVAARLQTESTPIATVTSASSAADKVAFFRRRFAGRTDVFPVRWENPKSGRSGYAPACANEWIRGLCGKPKIKCGACPNQAFIPVNDEVIACHLRGEDRIRPQVSTPVGKPSRSDSSMQSSGESSELR